MGHLTVEEFREKMDLCILNSFGFGVVSFGFGVVLKVCCHQVEFAWKNYAVFFSSLLQVCERNLSSS